MPEAHGGIRPQELMQLGIDPNHIIDFSVNSNPFGPPPGLNDYLLDVDLTHYPDPQCYRLKKILSEAATTSVDCIAIGNGSVELIWACVRAFVSRSDRVLVVTPTFGEYQGALDLLGIQATEYQLDISNPNINVEEINNKINKIKPKLTFICNPNNPTGHVYTQQQVQLIAASCETVGGYLVLDEAYRAFAGLVQFAPNPFQNTIVLRSMTKDFAIPGLRLGYALADKKHIEAITAQCPPWSVSAMAQKAGEFLLVNSSKTERTITKTLELAKQFKRQLSSSGLTPMPSSTHYFLVNVGSATTIRRRLLDSYILVRDCSSFGLPEYIRISTRLPEENAQLCKVLAQM